ncbi:DMT family transporter [Erysipelotrichaceae bacterium HCN-30851]
MIFGIIIVILSAIIYGIIPLLTKIIYTFDLDAISVSFFRFFLMIPILFMICFIKNKPLKINISSLISIFLYIALPSGFTMLLLNASYTYISIGTATTLHFLYPTFVILICSFYYHQKIERKIIVSLILITIGISCFIDGIDINGILGVLLAFLSAITYAIYLVQLEQSKFRRMDPLVLSLYTSICISIVLGIIGFYSKSLLFKESTFNSELLFYLVIFSALSMIALVFLQIGARYLGAKLTALFSLFEPITSIFAGIIFLNEELRFIKIIGCLFILFAMLNITFCQSKENSSDCDENSKQ